MRKLLFFVLICLPFIGTAQQDSLYKQRFQKLKNGLGLNYHPSVTKEINSLLKTKNKTEILLGRADHFFPIIDSILKAEKVPGELKFYAMAMSHLDFRYFDTLDGARGIWHFNYGNAKLADLQISSYVDERLHVVNSTKAFAKSLYSFYALYYNWDLALAAFSSSATKVNKAIRYNNNQSSYQAIKKDLPERAQECVSRTMAMMYIYHYAKEHKLNKQAQAYAQSARCLKVNQWLSLTEIAQKTNTPLSALEYLNQAYKRNILPDGKDSMVLCLPAKLKDSVSYILALKFEPYAAEYFDEKPSTKTIIKTENTVHKVKAGETLSSIAKEYACKVEDIKEWNDLETDDIQVGDDLQIQVKKKVSVPAPKKAPSYKIYVVKSGDTLGAIAVKNRCSVSQLRSWNNIRGDRIYPGQKLKIY